MILGTLEGQAVLFYQIAYRFMGAGSLVAAIILLPLTDARAASVDTLYDMSSMLNAGHPFASRFGTRWNPALSASPAEPEGTAPRVMTTPNPTAASYAGQSSVSASTPAGQMKESADRGGATRSGIYRTNETGDPLWGTISEMSLGVMFHDFGPLSAREEEGADIHVEIRFTSPALLDLIWSPEPHIGANISTSHQTSQVFFGLTYEWNLWKSLYGGFSLGGTVHDGRLASRLLGRKELGCPVLFRESVHLGWAFTDHHRLSVILDHSSNASLCDRNEGLENTGLRYSYRF